MNPKFLRGETWGLPGGTVEVIETHAAYVFLAGAFAFKMKKAVRLPYLDFSTLEKRRSVIDREFEINRALAPSVYVGVIEVDGEPVLKMNRFDNGALLAQRMSRGHFDEGLAAKLAAMAARAHHGAPRRDVPGHAIMAGLGAQLSQAFTSSADIFPASETLEFHALFEDALSRLKPLLDLRSNHGLVRRCHGDMHAGNIVLIGGEPVLFDAIEFSEKIATIDVLYDLAFLIMDLDRYGRNDAANLLLNHYLDLRRTDENLSGLAVMPLFLATRAGVRALVTADLVHELAVGKSLKQRGDALDYFRASIAYLKPAAPLMLCVGGLSGTGKSVLAAALAPKLGASPGAIHIRSDVERKALAGVDQSARLPAEAYGPQKSAEVYAAMLARAERALTAGHSVVVDAVFALEAERNSAGQLARKLGVPFAGIWLEAAPSTLKARVAARRNDASDATAEVVEKQLAYNLGHVSWQRIDAGGSPGQTAEAVRRILPYRRDVQA
jgi:hypothetical protein